MPSSSSWYVPCQIDAVGAPTLVGNRLASAVSQRAEFQRFASQTPPGCAALGVVPNGPWFARKLSQKLVELTFATAAVRLAPVTGLPACALTARPVLGLPT